MMPSAAVLPKFGEYYSAKIASPEGQAALKAISEKIKNGPDGYSVLLQGEKATNEGRTFTVGSLWHDEWVKKPLYKTPKKPPNDVYTLTGLSDIRLLITNLPKSVGRTVKNWVTGKWITGDFGPRVKLQLLNNATNCMAQVYVSENNRLDLRPLAVTEPTVITDSASSPLLHIRSRDFERAGYIPEMSLHRAERVYKKPKKNEAKNQNSTAKKVKMPVVDSGSYAIAAFY